jgi:hypothetical protein
MPKSVEIASYDDLVDMTEGFSCAGKVGHKGLNVAPGPPPAGRVRHPFGEGPFARLVMPPLPKEPGLYLWEVDGTVRYVGQTRMPLAERLGSRGYATISNYNTLARQPGKRNGGQQTNCRINALANQELSEGRTISIWFRVTADVAIRRTRATLQRRDHAPRSLRRWRTHARTIRTR